MIAAFETVVEIHAIKVVMRRGLKVLAIGLCNAEVSAADGVLQLPDWAFDGRPDIGPLAPGKKICTRCSAAAKVLREPR